MKFEYCETRYFHGFSGPKQFAERKFPAKINGFFNRSINLLSETTKQAIRENCDDLSRFNNNCIEAVARDAGADGMQSRAFAERVRGSV